MPLNSDDDTDSEEGRTRTDRSDSEMDINDTSSCRKSRLLNTGDTEAFVIRSGDDSSIAVHIDHLLFVSETTDEAGKHTLHNIKPHGAVCGPPDAHPLVTFRSTTDNGRKMYTVDDSKDCYRYATTILKHAFGRSARHFEWKAVTVDTSRVTKHKFPRFQNGLHPATLIFECDPAKVKSVKAVMDRQTVNTEGSKPGVPTDHVPGSA